MQVNGFKLLESLLCSTNAFNDSHDFEIVKAAVLKGFVAPFRAVRSSAASTYAGVLAVVIARGEHPIPAPSSKASKRSKNIADSEHDENERPSTPTGTAKKSAAVFMSIDDILTQLGTLYTKPSSSSRLRASVVLCYVKLLLQLGPRFANASYVVVLDNVLSQCLSAPTGCPRHRILLARRHARIILGQVLFNDLLGENGRLNALKVLNDKFLAVWSGTNKGQAEPSKYALVGAVEAIHSLLETLGSACIDMQASLQNSLLKLLSHPSFSVQVHAALCLRSLASVLPDHLLSITHLCLKNVSRELTELKTSRSAEANRKSGAFATALATLLSVCVEKPLYTSLEVISRIQTLAMSLLKSSGESDLKISAPQIQVAWTLIGGLMSLGPDFVKIHLSQLLLLWKNAMPKPLAKDYATNHSQLELSYLLHVRECALGSILSFLEWNSKLLTPDVCGRILVMLQNTSVFLKGISTKRFSDDPSPHILTALQVFDQQSMVQRRVVQCQRKMVSLTSIDSLAADVLTGTIAIFAHPEKYQASTLSAAIATSAGTFESLWELENNYAFGVSGRIRGLQLLGVDHAREKRSSAHWTCLKAVDDQIDALLIQPIIGGLEYDPVALYTGGTTRTDPPLPSSTALVDASIDLFANLLPKQTMKVQESILEQLVGFHASPILQKDVGRKNAVLVNTGIAILEVCKLAQSDGSTRGKVLKGDATCKTIMDILFASVTHSDPTTRNVAQHAIGEFCKFAGDTVTAVMVKTLIDEVVRNRDPHARAGCAVALSTIQAQVGGMAASNHLKNILGVLLSLCNDPHPTVHFWAVDAMARIIDSADYAFDAFVLSTLRLTATLYLSDTHHAECSSIASSNLELQFSTPAALALCLDSLINVLGPQLQESGKSQDLCLSLIRCLMRESDTLTLVNAYHCAQHLSLFSPHALPQVTYIRNLQKLLLREDKDLRDVAVDGLHQAFRQDAKAALLHADENIDNQLWLELDRWDRASDIKSILCHWLDHSAVEQAERWISRSFEILTKPFRKYNEPAQSRGPKGQDLNDEEVVSFAGGEIDSQEEGLVMLRWQVREFALECMNIIMKVNAIAKEDSNTDLQAPSQRLILRVSDIIRTAFSASISSVHELRLGGLRILSKVIEIFGHTPDPDFTETPLLEQFQAQIGSALTPAFAAESTVEVAAEAISVCALFIASGIVKDVDRMGRILRLLVGALESCAESGQTSIGDLKTLSNNSQVMIKMAVLSAWAELQVSCSQQIFLIDVVKPHIEKLAPLWLMSLREFARLRFEPDIATSLSNVGGSLETVYSAVVRATLLEFYQNTWLKLVEAIATLIEEDSPFVFDALDERQTSEPGTRHEINYRNEPVAFFFVLFGISFEALVNLSDDSASRDRIVYILRALRKILRPSVCGTAIYRDVIFTEATDLFDRLILTETPAIQFEVAQIAASLCLSHPASLRTKAGRTVPDDELSSDVEQLFELTRIVLLAMAGLLPGLTKGGNVPLRDGRNEGVMKLAKFCLTALVDMAECFPVVVRVDLYASILHVFVRLVETPSCVQVLISSTTKFKELLSSMSHIEVDDLQLQLIHMQIRSVLGHLLSMLHDDKRTAPGLRMQCLTMITVVVTSSVRILAADDVLRQQVNEAVTQELDGDKTSESSVSLQCLQSILLSDPPPATTRHCLLALITICVNSREPLCLRSCKVLVAFAKSVMERDSLQNVTQLLRLVIGTLVGAVKFTKRTSIGALILELAGSNPARFKQVLMAFSEEERQAVEGLVRFASEPLKPEDEAPSIELKIF